jgi:diguanylate cyclase (GGDEF)-like protein
LSAHLFVLLLNPAIALILGASLAIIWFHKPGAVFMRTAAIALFMFATAFIVQDIVPPMPLRLTSFATNLAFLATFTLLCVAVIQMSGGTVPIRTFTLVTALTAAAILWWLYGADSLTSRVHTMNVSHTVMSVMTLIAAWRSKSRGWGRSLALVVAGLALVNFASRPLIVIWEGNFYPGQEAFHDSIYWNSTRLGSPILAVFAALSLIVGLSMALIKELKLEARTDKLSGCLNRRGFEERAMKVLESPDRAKRPTTMIVADLDRFKQVNDTLGHATGDLVIQAFGAALCAGMPPGAVIGRMGGEEFAVLLAGDDARSANEFTMDCQTRFAQLQLAHGIPLVTASFGVYNCSYKEDLSKILTRADRALYEAKNAGRNAVRIHNAPLSAVPVPATQSIGQAGR